MKRTVWNKAISILLMICLVAGMMPYTANALELEAGTFNPNHEVEFNFNLQYTQHVKIEVLVNGEHFGWLIDGDVLDGYDGDLESHLPEAAYTIPTPSDTSHTAGVATSSEVEVKQTEGAGPGYHTILWTGSINGKPVVAANPETDQYTLTISIQPQGYPETGIIPCSTDADGNHVHGEDWIWPQQFVAETEVEFDYSTILAEAGLWEDILSLAGGFSYELMTQQMAEMSNFVNFDWLYRTYATAEELAQYLNVCENDPVSMIDGSYNFSYTDLRLEGQHPLTFTRAYNSRGYGDSLGKGFTHSFDYSLTEKNGYVNIYLPGGEKLLFLKLRDFETKDYYAVENDEFELWDNAGGWTLKFKRGEVYEFDSSGKLSEIRNETGQIIYSLSYSGDELSSVTGLAGSLSFTWDSGHITEVTDSAGRSVTYGYTGDNLISVTNPDGDSLTYSYDSNGYLAAVRDYEDEEYLRNTYDDKGRVTEQVFINANEETTATFSYDDENLINTYINAQGRETKYYYNQYRQLIKIVDEDGTTTGGYGGFLPNSVEDNMSNSINNVADDSGNISEINYPDGGAASITYTGDNLIESVTDQEGEAEHYGYDSNNQLQSYTDKNGNTSSYSYDTNGLLTLESDPYGNATSYTYDSAGRMLSTTDSEGSVFTYEYDAVGRITAVTDPIGSRTAYSYSPAGKLLSVTDALLKVTNYAYNKNGFTESTTDAKGGINSTTYGTNGQPLTRTDANGNITTYSYDEDGLLERVTDPLGSSRSFEYDNDGKVISETDAEGNTTEYSYDTLGRLEKTTDADGNETINTYDSMGRVTKITDANGGVTEYLYDLLGRTKKVIDAENGESSYSYDPNSNLLSSTDAEGAITSSTYDKLNRVLTETDGEGNVTSYGYDKVGRVKTVTDPAGGVTSYTYDLAGNMLTMTDPEGNITQYFYDALSRKVKEINADNTEKTFVYDAVSNLIESYDELDGKTSFTYDLAGNRLKETDPKNNFTTFTYDQNNRTASVAYADSGVISYSYTSTGGIRTVTDQLGNETAYTYDSLGRTSTVTDGEGIVTRYAYDALGNQTKKYIDGTLATENEYDLLNRVTKSYDSHGYPASYEYNKVGQTLTYTDREGNETSYSYDDNYRILTKKNALDGVYSYVYDPLGRTVSVTDEAGNSTSYTFDKNGRTLTETDPAGSNETYTYNAVGNMLTKTDKLGALTSFAYDAAGHVIKETDAFGIETSYVFDANGNITKRINRNNEKIFYEYDSMNRLVKETNELNHSFEYGYDLGGNKITYTDRNKKVTTYVYDSLNRVVSETNPNNSVKGYAYDAFGNVSEMTIDVAGGQRASTEYTHDPEGNLMQEVSPLGYITTFTYDKEGDVLTKTDENNKTTNYDYDGIYRLAKRTDSDGIAEFTYDPAGNMLTAKDGTGTVTFVYDSLYRATSVTDGNGKVTGYTYDAAGNRLSIAYPDSKAALTTYDILGQAKTLTDHDGKGIIYTRDAEERLIKEQHSDGSTTEYDYNAAGLLVQQKEVMANNSTRREILYGYDDNGNLKSEQRSGIGIKKIDENVRYYYDPAGQLTQTVKEGVTTNYSYDLAGNLLSDGVYTYTYDLQNRLFTKTGAAGATAFTYDNAGNLITETAPDGTTTYTYNGQNKLIKGTKIDGQSSTYTYNALGARVKNVQVKENVNAPYANNDLKRGSTNIKDYLKALSDGRAIWQPVWETEIGTTVQNNFETVTTDYVIDYESPANRDIMACVAGGDTARYVYDDTGRRISAEFTYADGTNRGQSGENIASDTSVKETNKIWYRSSALDSSLYAVDETGEVISHVIYDEWGNPLTETDLDLNYSGIRNINNYTGYTYDEVLSLYFAQNRFYDPENHRFTQEDIVKDGGNWYAYCGNRPMNYVDSLGLYYIIYNSEKETYSLKPYGTGNLVADAILTQVPFGDAAGWASEKFVLQVVGGSSARTGQEAFVGGLREIGENIVGYFAKIKCGELAGAAVKKTFVIISVEEGLIDISMDYTKQKYYDEIAFELMRKAGFSTSSKNLENVVNTIEKTYDYIFKQHSYYFVKPLAEDPSYEKYFTYHYKDRRGQFSINEINVGDPLWGMTQYQLDKGLIDDYRETERLVKSRLGDYTRIGGIYLTNENVQKPNIIFSNISWHYKTRYDNMMSSYYKLYMKL